MRQEIMAKKDGDVFPFGNRGTGERRLATLGEWLIGYMAVLISKLTN